MGETQDVETDSVRLAIEVTAGIVPSRPLAEFSRRYFVTSQEWHKADGTGKGVLLAEAAGRAQGYAGLLMLQPDIVNWVRTDWVWM